MGQLHAASQQPRHRRSIQAMGGNPTDWASTDAQYRVAYEAGLHRLEKQDATFDVVRGRVLQLITVTGAATAFLGAGLAVDSSATLGWLTYLALGSFAALLISALAMLWPNDWVGTPKASMVTEGYIERADGPASMAELY